MVVSQGTACTFAAPVQIDFGAARIRDVSLDGVGMILTKKVEVGALLAVVIENEAKSFRTTMLVKVAHATAVQGGWLVGGSFLTPLSYKDLTTLVM
jgi:hypothetical protein